MAVEGTRRGVPVKGYGFVEQYYGSQNQNFRTMLQSVSDVVLRNVDSVFPYEPPGGGDERAASGSAMTDTGTNAANAPIAHSHSVTPSDHQSPECDSYGPGTNHHDCASFDKQRFGDERLETYRTKPGFCAHLAPKPTEPCACAFGLEGYYKMLGSPRPDQGCYDHDGWGDQWCYVVDPSRCPTATPSSRISGARAHGM